MPHIFLIVALLLTLSCTAVIAEELNADKLPDTQEGINQMRLDREVSFSFFPLIVTNLKSGADPEYIQCRLDALATVKEEKKLLEQHALPLRARSIATINQATAQEIRTPAQRLVVEKKITTVMNAYFKKELGKNVVREVRIKRIVIE